MTSHAASAALVALVGCASAHRLVAPLAYDRGRHAAARYDDAFGAPPAIAASPAPSCIEWTKLALSNGIPLFIAERHAVPSAAVRVVFATGAMAAAEFSESTAKRLELLAATYLRHSDFEGDVSAECSRASCWVGGLVDAARVGDALAGLASQLTHPLPGGRSDVQQFVAAADSLHRSEDSPTASLWRNAEVMAFGRPSADPPARTPVEPTLADLIHLRAQLVQPDSATLVVAGDVSVAEVQAQAERAFGAWRCDRPPEPWPAASGPESFDPPFDPRVVHVPNNPYAMAFVAIVARGPAESSADAWAFRVAIAILGGGIESEIYVHVREELAAAYVTGAETRWFSRSSIATLGGALEPGKVIEATRAMLSAVHGLRADGPAPEVLDRAKARLKAELRASVSTNWLLTSSLVVSGGDVHPRNTCEAAARVDAVTAEAVRTAMRVYFADRRLGVVVIAQDHQLDRWPIDLGMGAVQRRDSFGQDMP